MNISKEGGGGAVQPSARVHMLPFGEFFVAFLDVSGYKFLFEI